MTQCDILVEPFFSFSMHFFNKLHVMQHSAKLLHLNTLSKTKCLFALICLKWLTYLQNANECFFHFPYLGKTPMHTKNNLFSYIHSTFHLKKVRMISYSFTTCLLSSFSFCFFIISLCTTCVFFLCFLFFHFSIKFPSLGL